MSTPTKRRGRPGKGPGGTPKTKGYKYVPKAQVRALATAAKAREERENDNSERVLESWRVRDSGVRPAPLSAIVEALGSNGVALSLPGKEGQEMTASEQGAGVWYGRERENCAMNVGGLVQCFGWAPIRLPKKESESLGNETTAEESAENWHRSDFLAVSANSSAHLQQTHVLGCPYSGAHAIQLWAVPRSPTEGEPALALALIHNSACVYALAWCSHSDDDRTSAAALPRGILPRLGLLAACMGDGALHVYAVPTPAHAMPCIGIKGQVHALVDPVFRAWRKGEYFATAEWNVEADVVTLAGGTADGLLALWRWPRDAPAPEAGQEPLYRVQATPGPLRHLSWCPEDSRLLACCSAWGRARVLDLRAPATPVVAHTLGNVSMALKWCRGLGIVAGVNNAFWLFGQTQVYQLYYHKDVVWGVDYCAEEFGVTVSDDGEAFLFKHLCTAARGPKLELLKLAQVDVDLSLGTPVVTLSHPLTEVKAGKATKKEQTLFHDLGVLRCAAINASATRRVAFGGGAGVVFCQGLNSLFPPL